MKRIDLLIEEHVMGLNVVNKMVKTYVKDFPTFREPLEYTKDSNLSEKVIQSMKLKGFNVNVSSHQEGWIVDFGNNPVIAKSLPLAISVSALKTLGVE